MDPPLDSREEGVIQSRLCDQSPPIQVNVPTKPSPQLSWEPGASWSPGAASGAALLLINYFYLRPPGVSCYCRFLSCSHAGTAA